jgi:hypothetical protein
MRSLPVQLVVVLVFALGPGQAAASDAKNPCAVPALGGAELAAEEPSGVGGTGTQERTLLAAADDDDSGMGGTGLDGADNAHGDDDSGMGGTGIVGTITGFGSICVNGLRIAYGPETPTERNGAAASADELAIGDVVNVAAKHDAATGELRASAIGVRHIVRGPIESIAVGNAETATPGSLQVLGQHVVFPGEWDPETVNALIAGDYVAISGQRLGDGSILSSRVVQLETRDAASLIGTLERLEGGRLRVAGIDVVAELELGDDLSGQYVVVSGSWDAETRSMRSAEIAPAVSFKDMSAHEISLGGYVEESDEDGFRVGGVRVEASAGRIDRLGTIAIDDYIVIRAIVTKSGGIRAVRIALDALPPRLMIPRPPRMDRMDRVPRMDLMPRPKRAQRQRVRRPALPPSPPRPPRIDVVPRPVRVLKLISG